MLLLPPPHLPERMIFMRTIAFLLCAGIIPLVPLFGASIFKRRKDKVRRNVCYGLFGLQLLLSVQYILVWFREYV